MPEEISQQIQQLVDIFCAKQLNRNVTVTMLQLKTPAVDLIDYMYLYAYKEKTFKVSTFFLFFLLLILVLVAVSICKNSA